MFGIWLSRPECEGMGKCRGERNETSCLTGHTRRIERLAISDDGKIVVSGSRDSTVRVLEK